MPTVFRKTTKGQTEVETRTHRLPPRLRALLILVDGRRDSAALAALVTQQSDSLLADLEAQGFIEAAPVQAAPAAAAAPRAAATGDADADFLSLKRSAVRALTDQLGPAAEKVAMRLERARTIEELRPLLAQAAQAVSNMRGRAAADAFAARFPAD